MSAAWIEDDTHHAGPLYSDAEAATTAHLDDAHIGTVLVTALGEGSAWVKIGSRSWVRPLSASTTSRKRPGYWFALKAPVIVWEPAGRRRATGTDTDFDEGFWASPDTKLMFVGRHLGETIKNAAGTFHIPLDVRTRIVTALLSGGDFDRGQS